MVTRRELQLAALEGGQVGLSPQQLQDLDGRLQGDLLGPGDPGWDEAVETWNAMVAKTPALVARPLSPADVAAAVSFARDHGVLLSVKGGGHNIAGTSMAEDGLTLDMSGMREVSVDPGARLAHAGPGCLLKDVDRATQEHGLAAPLGFVSETGMAGLTLGGGWGYLTRRFGWTVDTLEEVEIVTADGEIRVANREEHPDLFWAVRGGGGNFGVVTRFTFRLHEVGPTITGGMRVWSADRADEVLATYAELTASAPPELTAAAIVRLAPPAPFLPEEWHGKPVANIVVCYSGGNAESDLAPVRDLGDPVADLITEKPYVEQQSMVDALEPKGLSRYWKTEYLAGIDDEYLDVFREGALDVTSPLSQSVIFHLGGALNEREPDDGAVGNREARFISGFAGTWRPDTPADPHIDWVRRSWERIRPYSTGGNYVNFQVADDDSGRTAEAYVGNYERLQRVKAEYDPENLFRVNRNIPPAA
ncbi:MAG TPA: FAD-binding oxidoreductase [Actinomycetota bacterium]